jgi:60 kDa SS-A/Ro ribonucleoprotein
METLNSCGKEVFQISDVERVKRFLSLGCTSGTYYISPRDLMKEHLECIDSMLDNTESRNTLLQLIKEYAQSNKCKKQDPLVYLLARCCTHRISDNTLLEFRKQSYELVDEVCTTASILLMFIDFTKKCSKKYNNYSGWNNTHKRAITKWYNSRDSFELLYNLTKYKQRNGYSQRDVLRLCHIVPSSDTQFIFRYLVKNELSSFSDTVSEKIIDFIKDLESLKTEKDVNVVVYLIHKWHLAREHLPNYWLEDPKIWEAMMHYMPVIAMLRNLNKMTLCGVFDDEDFFYLDMIIRKITNIQRIHPIQLLISLNMYASGRGFKGKMRWNPKIQIINALEDKFYGLFEHVEKCNKRVCVALDVSASMFSTFVVGTECMNAGELSCGLAMILKAAGKENVEIMGFASGFVPIDIDIHKSYSQNLQNIKRHNFDCTDISKPFTWAQENNKVFDAFIVLTDSETNTNIIRPCDALRNYRKALNVPQCKLVVVAMASNGFSVADPNDKYMLDVAGFDASVPEVIQEFISFDF